MPRELLEKGSFNSYNEKGSFTITSREILINGKLSLSQDNNITK
jgi:hypothetical protein